MPKYILSFIFITLRLNIFSVHLVQMESLCITKCVFRPKKNKRVKINDLHSATRKDGKGGMWWDDERKK